MTSPNLLLALQTAQDALTYPGNAALVQQARTMVGQALEAGRATDEAAAPGLVDEPDWINAGTCIENMQIAYDDALEADPFDDGNPIPIDTCVDAGDLGVLIGLAKYAVAVRAARSTLTSERAE